MDDRRQGPKRKKGPFEGKNQRRGPSPRRDRRPEGEGDETLLEGRNAVTEALRSGSLGHLIAQARRQGVTAQEVDKRKLDAMSVTGAHQGIVALCAAAPYRQLDDLLALAKERGEAPLLVLCDGITDPHNLGAIIRTAECAGAHEGQGVSALVKKECDYVVRIPQKGKIPSLNASNAAAVLLYEAVRKRMQ